MSQISSDENRELRRPNASSAAPKNSAAKAIAARIDRWLFIVMLAGLAWAPLWLGGNRMFPWAVNALLFPGLVILYEAGRLGLGVGHSVSLKNVGASAFLFAAVVAFIFVQMGTFIPQGWVHPVWTMAAEVLGDEFPVSGSISVNRDLTGLALVRLLTSAAVFWLALQLCRDRMRANQLVAAVAVIVAAYSLVGIVLFVFSINVITSMGGTKTPDLSSTFVNRNSFATYAGLGLVCQFTLLLRMYQHEVESARGIRSLRVAKFLEVTGQRGWLWIAAGGVTSAALLLSASRGGIISTAVGLFVLIVLSFNRPNRRQANQWDIVLILVVLLSGVFLAFGDRLLARLFGQEGFGDVNRLAIYVIALRSVFDAPFLGFGYGTFADVFPIYRDKTMPIEGVLDKAHNTYLEIFQGLGLIFGAALLVCVWLLVFACYRGLVKREQSASIPIMATAAAFLVGVHALVDFSLQIQSVTLTFMALLGAGVAQSLTSRQSMSD